MIFEWDGTKEKENIIKHGIGFELACRVFEDEKRIIIKDDKHSQKEVRYIAIGAVDDEILTVRFTHRKEVIRVIGAGFWRKGKKVYEQENSI